MSVLHKMEPQPSERIAAPSQTEKAQREKDNREWLAREAAQEWTPEYIEQRFYAAGALHVEELSQAIKAALAAARVAIEEHDGYAANICHYHIGKTVDLSALHRHDTEVCKPLVEALRSSREKVTSLSMSDFKLQWLDEIDDALAKGEGEQMSEQQEWTPEYVQSVRHAHSGHPYDGDCALADAHNAALAVAKDWSPIAAENVRLTSELAAERQRAEQAEQQILNREQRWEEIEKLYDYGLAQQVQLRGQLLSAQAAIEKHNQHNDNEDCPFINVDLSALHEHDDEVRKPLVESLEDCESALAAFLPQHPAGPKTRATLSKLEENK